MSQQDVAYLCSAYARDCRKGTSEASNFRDAVWQHRLMDRMLETSSAFER